LLPFTKSSREWRMNVFSARGIRSSRSARYARATRVASRGYSQYG